MTERQNFSSGSSFEENIGYSRAVRHGDLLFVSGTTGFDYETMTISPDLLTQAEQAVRNVETALTAAGASFTDVVQVRYIFPDREDFEPCWPVFKRYFGAVGPAATMIVAGLYDPAMRLEIEVVARLSV